MIRKMLTKVLGLDNRRPIIDDNLYYNTICGFSGGSLKDKNCMLIHNASVEDSFISIIQNEGLIISDEMINSNDDFKIEKDTSDMLGPVEVFINFFQIQTEDTLKQITEIYKLLQKETGYFLNNCNGLTSVIVCVIKHNQNYCEETNEAFKSLVKGLSEVIGRHGIIINGVVATDETTDDVVAQWVCFLSSKYGYIMTGETMFLK